MIYVDELLTRAAPWAGGRSCHMVSDISVDELLSFAASIGIPHAWYQAGSVPHFDLAPRLRARALCGGAIAVDRTGLLAAIRRFRAANAGESAPRADP